MKRFGITLLILTGTSLLAATNACLTAGAGKIKPVPGADLVAIVCDHASAAECSFIRSVHVSDGIQCREDHRVHEGFEERAHVRLQNLSVHLGGNLVLITAQQLRYAPAVQWKIDETVYSCTDPHPAEVSKK